MQVWVQGRWNLPVGRETGVRGAVEVWETVNLWRKTGVQWKSIMSLERMEGGVYVMKTGVGEN